MEENVRDDILDILKKSYKAIKDDDIKELKELSNHIVHDMSIFQDEYSISTAVMIYSLSKVFERSKYTKYRDWPIFYRTVMGNLEKAAKALTESNIEEYEKCTREILKVIDKLGSNLKKYIEEVMHKAKISKASRVHEHGISIGRTAEILGISEWELMDYIGRTGIADVTLALTKRASERLKITRKIFGVANQKKLM